MADPVPGIPSPCRRECTLDNDDVCLGCGRTLTEICAWSTLDEAGKAQVVENATRRREEHKRRFPWAYR